MNTRRDNEEGMALLLATFFVAMAVVSLGAVVVGVVNEQRQVERFEDYEECMYGIESALSTSIASLEMGNGGFAGVDPASSFDPLAADPFAESGVTPLTLGAMPGLEYLGFAVNWMTDGTDNNGNGQIDEPEEEWYFTVYAYARQNGTVRRIEQVVEGVDVNVWRNAIFAGNGQAGGAINGNVSIHGSVHLLGNNILEGAQAIAAIELEGNSLIHNNYLGIPADLAARVPALETKIFNGEDVETLEAVLRVKNGMVGVSGSSEIGSPDAMGNTIKETMDSIYATDGWTGNQTIDGVPQPVYSDNGYSETYDLGDKVPMPMLQDDWRDPVTGQTVWDSSRNRNYSHGDYFREVLVGSPTNPADGIHNGSLSISTSSDFYYNASQPLDTNPANRQTTDDFIYFNSATNKMQINGQLCINGDLSFNGQGNDKTISYTGRGAILVTGNATLNTNLLTVNADGSTALSYPANNCFGIMAQGNLSVGGSAQVQLMGAFYAQGTVSSKFQTTTMGTFVGNYFDMGTNVPDIYQVPTLASNLPLGMIGNYPIMTMNVVSWRELGLAW